MACCVSMIEICAGNSSNKSDKVSKNYLSGSGDFIVWVKIKLTVTRLVGVISKKRWGKEQAEGRMERFPEDDTKAGGMTRRAKKSRKSFVFSNFTLLRVVLSAFVCLP